MTEEWYVYAIGFAAQLLFSVRLLLQWILSEKAKQVVMPSSFWIHSLAASFLLFIYGYLRKDFAIMLGQTITYYIYIRNLQLRKEWSGINIVLRRLLLFFPVIVIVYFFNNHTYDLKMLLGNENIKKWLLILGSTGQIVFTFRFIIQWFYSERIKESVLPLSFWWTSLAGSAIILTYSIFRKDPVLFAGQAVGFIAYIRNIILINKRSL